MKIRQLSPEGVLRDEQAALRELEQSLPKDWIGFAGFQLVMPYGNPLDIDLLMLTPQRLLLVELKNYSGEITDNAGQWYAHGAPRGRSPVKSVTDKARKLASFLKKKLPPSAVPYVEALVVTCNPNHSLILSEPERKRTLRLEEFLGIKDPARYEQLFPFIHPEYNRPSVQPLNALIKAKFELLFSNAASIRPLQLVVQNYKQEGETADFEHPRNLYKEFFAKHIESSSARDVLP